VYGRSQGDDAELLASCYRRSLEIADEHQLRSIAFPSISTGAYGYPIEEASRIALRTTRAFLEGQTTLEHVVFVTFSEEDRRVYEKAYREIFGGWPPSPDRGIWCCVSLSRLLIKVAFRRESPGRSFGHPGRTPGDPRRHPDDEA